MGFPRQSMPQGRHPVVGHDMTSKKAPMSTKPVYVAFGAPLSWTNFRLMSACAKYTRKPMVSEALVLQTIVCVMFRARRRSLWLGTLKGPSTWQLGHLGTPWPPKGFSIIAIHSSIHASIPPSIFFPDIPSCIFRRREHHAHEVS